MREPERIGLLYKVASLYYKENWKKYRIAAEINQSPTQVGNLLREAQEEGIIRIEVGLPRLRMLEERIVERYALKEAVIIPSDKDYETLQRRLGEAAAGYFEKNIKEGSKIGLSGGTTQLHMIETLSDRSRKIDIVPLVIAARGPKILHIDAYVLTTLLLIKSNWSVASAYGATLPPISSSLKNDTIKAARQLEQEHRKALQLKETKLVYEMMEEVDLAFCSAGPLNNPNVFQSTLRALKDRGLLKKTLEQADVIGDINYTFVDSNGRVVLSPHLTLGIDKLRAMCNQAHKKIVLIAGGPFKVAILRVILENSLCNVLITDEATTVDILP